MLPRLRPPGAAHSTGKSGGASVLLVGRRLRRPGPEAKWKDDSEGRCADQVAPFTDRHKDHVLSDVKRNVYLGRSFQPTTVICRRLDDGGVGGLSHVDRDALASDPAATTKAHWRTGRIEPV